MTLLVTQATQIHMAVADNLEYVEVTVRTPRGLITVTGPSFVDTLVLAAKELHKEMEKHAPQDSDHRRT